jgi:opacity protein-like surface antigen
MRFGSAGRSLILGACVLAMTATAARADENPFNRPGAFAGLGGTYAVSAFQGPLKDFFGDSLGFQARGGYRFDEIFAVEALYEYVDDFGVKRGSGGIWTNNFAVGGKLILPLDRFQPYLSGGIGFLNAEANNGGDGQWAFAGRFSGGTDLAITEHVALFLDAGYVIPAGGGAISEIQYFSFGWGGKYLF